MKFIKMQYRFLLLLVMSIFTMIGCSQGKTETMSELSISQEQAFLFKAGIPVAVETLAEGREYTPTLFIHDGETLTYFNILADDPDEIREMARGVIRAQVSSSICYALIYDAEAEDEAGTEKVVIIETGDVEDEAAHKLLKKFTSDLSDPMSGLIRIEAAEHLLK